MVCLPGWVVRASSLYGSETHITCHIDLHILNVHKTDLSRLVFIAAFWTFGKLQSISCSIPLRNCQTLLEYIPSQVVWPGRPGNDEVITPFDVNSHALPSP